MSIDFVKKIKKIIADRAGQEPSDIQNSDYFEDDLNIGQMDLIEILEELEDDLQIELVEEKDNIQTVGDLLELVEEQID